MKEEEKERQILSTRMFIQSDQIIDELVILELSENKNNPSKQ
jgi:hypothetical protein